MEVQNATIGVQNATIGGKYLQLKNLEEFFKILAVFIGISNYDIEMMTKKMYGKNGPHAIFWDYDKMVKIGNDWRKMASKILTSGDYLISKSMWRFFNAHTDKKWVYNCDIERGNILSRIFLFLWFSAHLIADNDYFEPIQPYINREMTPINSDGIDKSDRFRINKTGYFLRLSSDGHDLTFVYQSEDKIHKKKIYVDIDYTTGNFDLRSTDGQKISIKIGELANFCD